MKYDFNNTMFEDRISIAKCMHNAIVDMNNEDAYMTWIWLMPDEPMHEDFVWFAEDKERYDELWDTFIKIVNRYKEDGLFRPCDSTIDLMSELGIEIEILK